MFNYEAELNKLGKMVANVIYEDILENATGKRDPKEIVNTACDRVTNVEFTVE